MIRSLYHLQNADMGMDARNVLAAALIFPHALCYAGEADAASTIECWTAFEPCPAWKRRV